MDETYSQKRREQAAAAWRACIARDKLAALSIAIIRAHVEEAGLAIERVWSDITTYGNGDVSRTVTIRVPRAMLEAQAECEREAGKP